LYGKDVFYPTEFMHGLFDGGMGAALDDFWNQMKKHPLFAGGFLWSFHDEGVVRVDRGGIIDVSGNAAPDGILGPHREKEASFYTVKELWSPVIIHTSNIPEQFDGRISIENAYLYSNLENLRFSWKWVAFAKAADPSTTPIVICKGETKPPALLPGEMGWLQLPACNDAKAEGLILTVLDSMGKEIITRSWPLKTATALAEKSIVTNNISTAEIKEDAARIVVTMDNITYSFDKRTGFLGKVWNGKKEFELSGGPALAGVSLDIDTFHHFRENDCYIVEAIYKGAEGYRSRWCFEKGRLPKLSYQYAVKSPVAFHGITFNLPEENIQGMKWLGRGPYRVWKNRTRGQQLGVWEKAYNNTITGESWLYPEFKGWHAELYWARIQLKDAAFTVYNGEDKIFLQMLQPARPAGARNEYTSPPFPDAGIGFMHGISPIGTKFQSADRLGPQGALNTALNYSPFKGSLWFDFR
ncbi:MAG: glycoside hydrolase family 2, partial [Chitinophagaceae bacterium]|nr:glycoside hydrolase family 2 [Chitinophagaceae bacterium]